MGGLWVALGCLRAVAPNAGGLVVSGRHGSSSLLQYAGAWLAFARISAGGRACGVGARGRRRGV